jgi:GABA(A) receptor-associated protein
MMKSSIVETIKSNLNIFNDNSSLLYTKEEANRVRTKYPDRIPVIVNRSVRANSDVPHIDKHKFLVPCDLTMGQLQYVIRKRISLPPTKALFLFIDNVIIPTSSIMSNIYDMHQDHNTNFLYVTYDLENTFG